MNNTNNIKLKPCPFCGSLDIDSSPTSNVAWRVACIDCGATMSGKVLRYSLEWIQGKLENAWNIRYAGLKLEHRDAELEFVKHRLTMLMLEPDVNYHLKSFIKATLLHLEEK